MSVERGFDNGIHWWFTDVRLEDAALRWGKGANLGELTARRVSVPPGFVITGEAYLRRPESCRRTRSAGGDPRPCTGCGAGRPGRLADDAQQLVRGIPVPDDLASAVLDAYHRLGQRLLVAVRSSGIGEDAEGTSFAGMNALHQRRPTRALGRIVDCWASLYGARSISLPVPARTSLTSRPSPSSYRR